MSRNELIAKIEALNEWEAMMEEAKTEADAIRSSIKAEMEERGVEECSVLNMKIVRPFVGGVGGDFGRRCHKF